MRRASVSITLFPRPSCSSGFAELIDPRRIISYNHKPFCNLFNDFPKEHFSFSSLLEVSLSCKFFVSPINFSVIKCEKLAFEAAMAIAKGYLLSILVLGVGLTMSMVSIHRVKLWLFCRYLDWQRRPNSLTIPEIVTEVSFFLLLMMPNHIHWASNKSDLILCREYNSQRQSKDIWYQLQV